MARIDFEQVRRQVSLSRVLDFLGYTVMTRDRSGVRGPCPLKCSTNLRNCSLYLKDNRWKCHRCGASGNQLDLYMQVKGLQLYPAAVELCLRAGLLVPYLVPPGGYSATAARREGRRFP